MCANFTIDGASTYLVDLLNTQGAYVYGGPVYLENGGRVAARSATQSMRVNGAQIPIDGTKLTPAADDIFYNTNAAYGEGIGLTFYDGTASHLVRNFADGIAFASLASKVAVEAAPTFNPNSGTVATLAAWYKADAGILDSSGSCITVDGTAVKTWWDQSGNANHLVQATTANQAAWQATIQNGLPRSASTGPQAS